jgi:transposase
LEEALRLLAARLHEQSKLNLEEAFVDATFASAKKGASLSALPGAERARKSSLSPPITALPLAVSVESASSAECQLVEDVLAGSFLDQLPARLIGDKACDSDPLDQKLAAEYNIEMIARNRHGRRQKTQDGRKVRRYRRRWKVERLFAWMHNFRRLVTRCEYHVENFLGFVHLACLHMMLKYL